MSNIYDAIILGCGGMGSAAAYHLAARGLRVLTLDRHNPAHELGSSHGRSRVIRKAYFEDPRYVPLLHRAYELWHLLETITGSTLLHRCGVLNIGPADHPCVQGAQQSATLHGLPFELLDSSEIHRRWPALAPGEFDSAVFESDAGFVPPETTTRLHIELATRHGAVMHWSTPVRSWCADASGVRVRSDDDEFTGRALVITAGAWLPELTGSSLPPLRVERQVQLWWTPKQPALVRHDRLPAFIHFTDSGVYYSAPLRDGDPGIKIARHHGGATTTAESLDRTLHPADEADVRAYIRRHIPVADGPLAARSVCMYTNTPDDHFILDHHPAHENVIIAGGFSGHGFKFAPLVGEIVADLVTSGQSRMPVGAFSLKRS